MMKAYAIFQVSFVCAPAAMRDVSPGCVEAVDRLRRKVFGEVNILSAHPWCDIQQLAAAIEAENGSHAMDQLLRSLNVVGDAIFPKTKIQITVVPISVVFYAAGIKILDLAFMRARAPLLSFWFTHAASLSSNAISSLLTLRAFALNASC